MLVNTSNRALTTNELQHSLILVKDTIVLAKTGCFSATSFYLTLKPVITVKLVSVYLHRGLLHKFNKKQTGDQTGILKCVYIKVREMKRDY